MGEPNLKLREQYKDYTRDGLLELLDTKKKKCERVESDIQWLLKDAPKFDNTFRGNSTKNAIIYLCPSPENKVIKVQYDRFYLRLDTDTMTFSLYVFDMGG